MKSINFIIFFSIVLIIHSAINFYIFNRGWQALELHTKVRIPYLILCIILGLSFFLGRVLERYLPSTMSEIFVWIGSFWFAAMLYFLLIIILLDLARLLNHWIPIFSLLTRNYAQLKYITLVVSAISVGIIIIIGYINARTLQVKTLHLTINKPSEHQELNLVIVSDIHLGTIIGRNRFCKIVDRINSLNPDLVLMPGDIVDEDLAPVVRGNLGDALKNIRPKFGVVASTGNHEFIGGVDRATQYLKEHNVILLRDEVLKLNGIYIVGREDRTITQFIGKQRQSLADLMAKVDVTCPVILLDHQPFNLQEAVNCGVDLQLSGHTHHGQLWPVNYITEAIYEISWGYMQKGKTHFYVSCGVGTWGPPARLGSRAEIINIKLNFKP
jgi:uncharacterized protein